MLKKKKNDGPALPYAAQDYTPEHITTLPCMPSNLPKFLGRTGEATGGFSMSDLYKAIQKNEAYNLPAESSCVFYDDAGKKCYSDFFTPVTNFPGFFFTWDQNIGTRILEFFPPNNPVPCFVAYDKDLVPDISSNRDAVLKFYGSEDFEKAIVQKLISNAAKCPEYFDVLPLYVLQKAKDYGIDYETPVLDGLKQTFINHVLNNATPEMDCTEATKDAAEKIEHLQKTFEKIRQQLEYLEQLKQSTTLGGE